MKQVTIEKSERYRYCNYCKYFQPLGDCSDEGHCNHPSKQRKYISTYFTRRFFDDKCENEFEMTIHNHCNVESPEFIKEYHSSKMTGYSLRMSVLCSKESRHFVNHPPIPNILRDTEETKNKWIRHL